jgi:transposase-like protein
MAKWKHYDLNFKRRTVARMAKCESITALAQELKIHRSVLYIWRRQLEGTPGPRRADLSQARTRSVEKKLREENRLLKETLGEKVLEADFFVDALRSLEEQRRKSAVSGVTLCTLPSNDGAENGRKAN